MTVPMPNRPYDQQGKERNLPTVHDSFPRDPLSPEKSRLPFPAQLLAIRSLLNQSVNEEGVCLQNTEAGDEP